MISRRPLVWGSVHATERALGIDVGTASGRERVWIEGIRELLRQMGAEGASFVRVPGRSDALVLDAVGSAAEGPWGGAGPVYWDEENAYDAERRVTYSVGRFAVRVRREGQRDADYVVRVTLTHAGGVAVQIGGLR